METDRKVVLLLGILEHHVQGVGLSGRGQHEPAVLEEMTCICQFWPLDMAEGAGEVVFPGEPGKRAGGFGREKYRHRRQGKKREKHQ